MMSWIGWILKTLGGFLDLRKLSRKKKKLEDERQRLEDESQRRILESDIKDDIENVEKPDLDSKPDSDDPMGVDRWNRDRRD